jgi:hypothetical protein
MLPFMARMPKKQNVGRPRLREFVAMLATTPLLEEPRGVECLQSEHVIRVAIDTALATM